MEQDKQLKQILLNSAEWASADFADTVMKKVTGLAASPLNYQPLVSPKLKRLFVFIFCALVAAILGLCMVIALTNLQLITWIQNRELPELNYKTILMFILSFWLVFTINSIMEKKFFLRKKTNLQL